MTLPVKPVRKTSRSSRGVRGLVPSMGYYESALERDMMELIRFDRTVSSFTAQPLTIPYSAKDGKACSYTPDGLITFSDSSVSGSPILYEIKYREDFRGDWRNLMQKFRAAKNHCAEIGWRFRVYTEKEIRTPYLTNVKFLWPFIERSVDPAVCSTLLASVERLGVTTPKRLMHEISSLQQDAGLAMPVLWHLIAIGRIKCDLQEKLSLNSRVWSSQEVCLE